MSDLPPEPEDTLCIACHLPVPIGASICHRCGSYQRRCLNWLRYLAGVAILIALLGSAVTYGVTAWPSFRAAVCLRRDVGVSSFDSTRSIVVRNRGDCDVFASYARVIMVRKEPPWISPEIPINRMVESGSFLVQAVPNPGFRGGVNAAPVVGLRDQPWDELLNRAIADDRCFQLVFHLKDSRYIEDLSAFGKDLRTFDALGFVVAEEAHGEAIRFGFTAIGTVWRLDADGCDQARVDTTGGPVEWRREPPVQPAPATGGD